MTYRLPLSFALAVLAAGFVTTPPAAAEDAPPRSEFFDEFDANRDGKVTLQEFEGSREMFDLLDKDKDGVISTTDLGVPETYRPKPKRKARKAGGEARARKTGGEEQAAKVEKQARKQFARMDKNGDGQLSPDEVPAKRLFQAADADGSGHVTADEMVAFMQKRAARGGNDRKAGNQGNDRRRRSGGLSAGRLKSWDRDKDGKVSADEFPGREAGFKRLDVDGDGFLTEADVKAAKARNQQGKGNAKKKAKKNKAPSDPFAAQDADGDGRLTRAEFAGTNAAWRAADKNGDGYVSREEAGGK